MGTPPKTHLDQTYFHDDIKMLFTFVTVFTLVLIMQKQWSVKLLALQHESGRST